MLKYYFDVEFTDGTTYTQNADDRSVFEPEKRSCFFDVKRLIEEGRKIRYFMLSDGKDVYMVDLTDGHFEINGKSFFMHERRDFTDFEIIFFRQHTHNFMASGAETAHDIVYRMGWQTNKDGQNFQQVMEIE